MKLCVLENLYGNKTLEESLSILTSLGVHTVEVGAGEEAMTRAYVKAAADIYGVYYSPEE